MPNGLFTPPSPFTPEALALSASLFSSSIDSWIPNDFGVKRPDSEKQRDFERAFRPAGINENDRLGLGHPLLDAPKPSGSRSGLTTLGKRVTKGQTVDEFSGFNRGGGSERHAGEDAGDEEEESRSRSIGKGKKTRHPDILMGRSRTNKSIPPRSATTTKRTVLHTSVSATSSLTPPLTPETGETLSTTRTKPVAPDNIAASTDRTSSLQEEEDEMIGATLRHPTHIPRMGRTISGKDIWQ